MKQQATISVAFPDETAYEQPTGLFINNEFVAAADGETFETVDPFTQKPICSVSRGKAQDINHAVDAARLAFPSWKKTGPQERSRLLHRLCDLIERDATVLAKIESIDAGKPVHIAVTADVGATVACLRYYAGWADKIRGHTMDTGSGTLSLTLREPYGVVGLITPWNFPFLMCGWKLGPALCTGNTVVLKPAELTPLSALYLAGLIQEAGFPPGVVNIVPGFGHDAGATLASHPHVSKISFTGSTLVGRSVLRASAASNIKKVGLELGGKSPSLVFETADIDKAVESINGGIFYNMGQNCCASSRVYVHENIYDTFLDKFVERARSNKLGSPFDTSTFLGPQISGNHHAKIMGMIEAAKAQGAVCATGGTCPGGWFVEPTVFRDVSESMEIMKQEVFGPVVTVSRFKDVSEVIGKANDSAYGLAAGIFTSNVQEAITVATELESGNVWINDFNMISHQVPHGGYKESGNGKDLGEEALDEFTQLKSVRFAI